MFMLLECMKCKYIITHYDVFSLIVSWHTNVNFVAFETSITTSYEHLMA